MKQSISYSACLMFSTYMLILYYSGLFKCTAKHFCSTRQILRVIVYSKNTDIEVFFLAYFRQSALYQNVLMCFHITFLQFYRDYMLLSHSKYKVQKNRGGRKINVFPPKNLLGLNCDIWLLFCNVTYPC